MTHRRELPHAHAHARAHAHAHAHTGAHSDPGHPKKNPALLKPPVPDRRGNAVLAARGRLSGPTPVRTAHVQERVHAAAAGEGVRPPELHSLEAAVGSSSIGLATLLLDIDIQRRLLRGILMDDDHTTRSAAAHAPKAHGG